MEYAQREDRRSPKLGSAISMPRELSRTPVVANITGAMSTPHIQKCHLESANMDDHPLEHITVTFEEDAITLKTTGLLGKGGFGKVFSAYSSSGEAFALKVSTKEMNENDWKRLKEEVTLMSHFSRHPNIVRFFAAGRDEERAYVLMERCASRSLHDVIAYRSLEIPEILWIGWSAVDTISYLHSKGCIHRDLKPQNLLFDRQGNLKITDFGLSSRISKSQPRKTVAGTAMYMAPEMAKEVYNRMTRTGESPSLSYGKEVDTWSLGVVLYVLMTRMNPYVEAIERTDMKNLDREQKSLALFNAVAGAAWSWPKGWIGDQQLCNLVERILDRRPSHRATLQEVLEDSVWNRRPLTCPISLLQKLNILERSPPQQPLNHIAGNVPTGTKRVIAMHFEEAIIRVETTEQRARAQLTLTYQEILHILGSMWTLLRDERDMRRATEQEEEVRRGQMRNRMWMQRTMPARGRSVALVSEATAMEIASPRSSRSVRASVSLTGEETQGKIVRASPDQYAVVYSGRDTATRWNLRPVVSLPRELNNMIEQDFKCMNNHVMTKLTCMPHGYNGFDCNVCDRGILKITADVPAFRCYKCDYDVCMKCAYSGRFKEVNFVCITCSKKFTSSEKLRAHSLRCRGPSESLSPRRSVRMQTMLWEEPKRPSLLEVQLPISTDTGGRSSGRRSSRATYGRTSVGGRISIGNTSVPSPEDIGGLVVEHKDADFPDVSRVSTRSGKGGLPRSRPRDSSSSNEGITFDLPPKVHVPPTDYSRRDKVEPRSSSELHRSIHGEDHGMTPPEKRHCIDPTVAGIDPLALAPTSPPVYNDQGEIVGIAARRHAVRAASVDMNNHLASSGTVTIRADNAALPKEVTPQPHVPRSVSSTRGNARSGENLGNPRSTAATMPPSAPLASHLVSLPMRDALRQVSVKRAPSVSGMTAQGGPPLPRKGPAAPNIALQRNASIPASIPTKGVLALRQSRASLANSMSITYGGGSAPTATASSNGLTRSGGAYLALPREQHNRQQFVENFLSGGWVRFYSFTNEDTVVLYYSLQPGRYGAMFPTEAGVGTAVVDVHSKLILYVPCMNNESTHRNQPHPHVQTFYDEEARILSVAEAQRYLSGVLKCIMGFVGEIARLRAEGLTPAAVHAAYIHHPNLGAVPRDTKFVYIRKVFPDPSGSFTLFRLSNLRSQVVCNAMLDIRWQSDRRHNVGQKYYVNADGTAEPFVIDHTGILSQVETVLSNSFRR